ncbi:hypothetical protein J2Z40_000985 [Cytobacillus eiseniae]|uniref:Uncharacterized protein n=1 Tax=Cytobacillus eiseniae TaxID=762947 RepID=A0ABS4RBZ7_9BACI|nr:hypothetical protein [Cytobacillus eiseniae]
MIDGWTMYAYMPCPPVPRLPSIISLLVISAQ